MFIYSSFADVQNLDEKIRSYWERECLCLVRERTAVQRHEEELNMAKQGLALENERARAENEYRQLINRTGFIFFYSLTWPIDVFLSFSL